MACDLAKWLARPEQQNHADQDAADWFEQAMWAECVLDAMPVQLTIYVGQQQTQCAGNSNA